MIIYLDDDFNPVEENQATIARVIPDNDDPPYFIAIEKKNDAAKEETD